jgi:hypothetical protein
VFGKDGDEKKRKAAEEKMRKERLRRAALAFRDHQEKQKKALKSIPKQRDRWSR